MSKDPYIGLERDTIHMMACDYKEKLDHLLTCSMAALKMINEAYAMEDVLESDRLITQARDLLGGAIRECKMED